MDGRFDRTCEQACYRRYHGAFTTTARHEKTVGMEGCAACGRMEDLTYADSEVINIIDEHFVAIEVDAEARPDIGERYSSWAWPATIFLAPDGTQVLGVRGNRLPRNFIPILNDLIAKHEAGALEPDPRSPFAAPPEPAEVASHASAFRGPATSVLAN